MVIVIIVIVIIMHITFSMVHGAWCAMCKVQSAKCKVQSANENATSNLKCEMLNAKQLRASKDPSILEAEAGASWCEHRGLQNVSSGLFRNKAGLLSLTFGPFPSVLSWSQQS
jgi:hypothetical protein